MTKKMSKKKKEVDISALTLPPGTESLDRRIMELPFWYHRIELPDGIVTPGWAPLDASKYGIPDDLTGKRVLDIGAWDGYWTWEALKRGASEVVAIDDFSDNLGILTEEQRPKWETFDLCREAFGFTTEHKRGGGWENDKKQIVNRKEMSVYDIESLGHFDIVFFFGTVYHLKHPTMALEVITKVCDDELYIESATLDHYSPYDKRGVGWGYGGQSMLMEYYPENQYGNNVNNHWVPSLKCLGNMVRAAGFLNVTGWPLTEEPQDLSQCRGFVYASKTVKENAIITKLSSAQRKPKLRVGAVMSVPRLGFQDNSFCILEGLVPLGIPIIKSSGAFWGQCLEKAIQRQVDEGFDAIFTVDYDTIFTIRDAQALIKLMEEHPEADAIVAMQAGRGDVGALLTIKTLSGKVRGAIPEGEFMPDVTKIATGHFGLTLLRASSLLKMPTPWFWAKPNRDSKWGPGKIDDDIYFWKLMEKCGLTVYSANRVVLGHLQLMVKWLGNNLDSTFQTTSQFRENGKPENIWI